jgi:heat shock protein HslJ
LHEPAASCADNCSCNNDDNRDIRANNSGYDRHGDRSTRAARNGTELTAPTGDPVTLTFIPDGTLSGNGGCNDYSAGFSLIGQPTSKGDAIAVGPITATKMFCNRVAAQEQTYFTILHQAVAYDVNINTLRIVASDGTYLTFATGNP